MWEFWKKVFKRALRRALELARIESWERIAVFLIVLAVPALITWYVVGDHAGALVRALASVGGSAIAVLVVFIWNVLKLPAVMATEHQLEIDQLRTEIDRRQRIEVALGMMSTFIKGAFDLINVTISDEAAFDQWISGADQWIQLTYSIIETTYSTSKAQAFYNIVGFRDNTIYTVVFNDRHQYIKRCLREWASRLHDIVDRQDGL